jgi:hypothetical protein
MRLTNKLLKLTEDKYVWGVFKDGKGGFYANTYFDEQTYLGLVKGNLTQAEAEKQAAEMNPKATEAKLREEGGWNDPEAIDSERMDADMEMADLQAAGNASYRRLKRAKQLYDKGDKMGAAKMCPHGWSYPLNSIAAREGTTGHIDPKAGGVGERCIHCGSVVNDAFSHNPTIIEPCSFLPDGFVMG